MKAPELVSVTDIGVMAGVSRQRAHQLAAKATFPKPAVEHATFTYSMRLWSKSEVETWLKGRR